MKVRQKYLYNWNNSTKYIIYHIHDSQSVDDCFCHTRRDQCECMTTTKNKRKEGLSVILPYEYLIIQIISQSISIIGRLYPSYCIIPVKIDLLLRPPKVLRS